MEDIFNDDIDSIFGFKKTFNLLGRQFEDNSDPCDILLRNTEELPNHMSTTILEETSSDLPPNVSNSIDDILQKNSEMLPTKIKKTRKKKCQVCDKSPEEGGFLRKDMKFSICPSCRPMCAFKTCPMQEDLQLGEVGLFHNGFCSMHSRQFNKACTETSWAPQHPQRQHAHPFILPQLNHKSFLEVEKNMELACIEEALQHVKMLSTWNNSDIDDFQWTRIMEMVHARAENIGLRNGYQNIKRLPVVIGMSFMISENEDDKKNIKDKKMIFFNPHIDVENAKIDSIRVLRNHHDRSIVRNNIIFHIELLKSSNLEISDIFQTRNNGRCHIDQVILGHCAIRSMAHTQRYHIPLMPCDASGKIGFGRPRPEHLTEKSWEFRNFYYFRQAPVSCSQKTINNVDEKHPSLIFYNKKERLNNSMMTTTILEEEDENVQPEILRSYSMRNKMKNNFRKHSVAGSDTIKQKRRKRRNDSQILNEKARKKMKKKCVKIPSLSSSSVSTELNESICSIKFELSSSSDKLGYNSSSYYVRKCSIKLQTNMAVGIIGGFMINSTTSFWTQLPKKKNKKLNGKKIKELLLARKQAVLRGKLNDYTYVIL